MQWDLLPPLVLKTPSVAVAVAESIPVGMPSSGLRRVQCAPPSVVEEFPQTVLRTSVSVPALDTAPPCDARLPVTVLR